MSLVGNRSYAAALVGRYDAKGQFYYPELGAYQTDGAPAELMEIIHPWWTQFPPANPMINWILAFVYSLLWVVNFVGNGAVIHVFATNRSLRSPSNLLVVNLAIADFCMMLSQGPLYIFNVFYSRWWYWGVLGCEIYGITGGLFGIGAIWTMVAIGYDRYVVITNSISGPRLTNGKSVCMILFIWSYALGVTLPPFLKYWGRFVPEGLLSTCTFDYLTDTLEIKAFVAYIFTMAYVIPLTILTFCYSRIVMAVFAHEKTLREQAKKMNVDSLRTSGDQKEQSMEIKIAKASLTAVFLWIAIWTPYATVVLTGAFGKRELITPVVSQIPSVACKFAACLNPLVFAISHPKFQAALRKRYPWLYCSKKSSSDDASEVQSNAVTIKS
ncbi:unnamed protein product [Allacma fusca]|uniref:G-protein coupled receptors family 1 profile domain-containing protein n=1 Tax=Allacma fusca TaxID=39272 RepID=A0A8J2KUQ1_9HEXA|nr:unnamed protein product [Allacma fusca]